MSNYFNKEPIKLGKFISLLIYFPHVFEVLVVLYIRIRGGDRESNSIDIEGEREKRDKVPDINTRVGQEGSKNYNHEN